MQKVLIETFWAVNLLKEHSLSILMALIWMLLVFDWMNVWWSFFDQICFNVFSDLNFVSDFWLKEFLADNYFFLRPIYGQSSNWGCWFWWCWFDLISFNTIMTALILIFSQMFDWKNFWQSTVCFLRSIYNQGCTLCYWDWWCWFNVKSFSTTMTTLILILSQFFDWNNFLAVNFLFLAVNLRSEL